MVMAPVATLAAPRRAPAPGTARQEPAAPGSQSDQAAPATPGRQSAGAVPAAAVPVVSLDRIRRALRESPPRRRSSILNLEFHVEVVGQAPRVLFFKDFNLNKGSAVQYGGMTHSEFMNLVAPPWRPWPK
jgi:hypothetical protein